MLDQKDIEEAKRTFRVWDNEQRWHLPSQAFLDHTKKKAKETLELAIYLLDKLENTKELDGNETATMWIIAKSYYSMFFNTEYLLGLDGRKLPENTEDTHKTTYLAFLYYYLVKGSELEQKKISELDDISTSRMSRALALFKEMQDETLELARVQEKIGDLKNQREKRNLFTYRMNRSAELREAKNSITKAAEFRQLVEEYIHARKR